MSRIKIFVFSTVMPDVLEGELNSWISGEEDLTIQFIETAEYLGSLLVFITYKYD